MGFEIKQQLKIGQNLLMTPALQQAIKLLQLSRIELEQYVAEQLAENPILEDSATDASSEEVRIAEEKEKEHTQEDFTKEQFEKEANVVEKSSESEVNLDSFSKNQDFDAKSQLSKSGSDKEAFNYENVLSYEKTLHDFLGDQASEVGLEDEEKRIVSEIIGNIDDRGYLPIKVEELAKKLNTDINAVEDLLDTVQRFEPNGVGARDLRECLLLQVRNSKLKNGTVEKIVADHLKSLENRDFDHIAKKLGITVEQVIDNVEIISSLDPVPGRQFHRDSSIYIVPDVYILKSKKGWYASLNKDGLPRLKINQLYSGMIEKKSIKADDKEYLQNKLKEASWLIKSIEQRQKTIMKVAESILERQQDFFNLGEEHLKPMILRDVASDIEMHESTVSRVTTNKYMHTPRGVFELKYFFNNSVSRSDGEQLASESVKVMISTYIKEEDTKKPYSDQQIVDYLDQKGIQLARRTVAKYRESLGILPSSKRKKFY